MSALPSYRVAAACFLFIAIATGHFALGFWPGDLAWTIRWFGIAAAYLGTTALLWRQHSWSGPVAFGLSALASGFWIQSAIALIWHTFDDAALMSLTTCLVSLLPSLAAVVQTWRISRAIALRHRLSLAFAAAATLAAFAFAVAPGQSLLVALAMAAGSATLFASTLALACGRTWGLLGNLLGAVVIATGAAQAPWLAPIHTVHRGFPNATDFLINVLGNAAAGLAMLSVVPYALPIFRFLRAR